MNLIRREKHRSATRSDTRSHFVFLATFHLKFGRGTSTAPLLSVLFADTTGSLYKQQTPRMSDWFKRECVSSEIVLMLRRLSGRYVMLVHTYF